MNGFLSLVPGERGRQTVDYPTKKATIKGGRRFIASTSFDDSSTALLVSVRLALRPLKALMARLAGPTFLWGSWAALASSVTSVRASARVSSGSCVSASTLTLSSWSSSPRLGWLCGVGVSLLA
jgi:hypothetical protein